MLKSANFGTQEIERTVLLKTNTLPGFQSHALGNTVFTHMAKAVFQMKRLSMVFLGQMNEFLRRSALLLVMFNENQLGCLRESHGS
jgi:hypothetical protein